MPSYEPATSDARTLCPGPTTTRGVTVHIVSNVTVLDLAGPLTWDRSVETFRREIWELLDAGAKDLAINLAKVPYVDSAGLGALLAFHNSIRGAGGTCKFFAAQEHVKHALSRIRLNKVLMVFDDELAAVTSH